MPQQSSSHDPGRWDWADTRRKSWVCKIHKYEIWFWSFLENDNFILRAKNPNSSSRDVGSKHETSQTLIPWNVWAVLCEDVVHQTRLMRSVARRQRGERCQGEVELGEGDERLLILNKILPAGVWQHWLHSVNENRDNIEIPYTFSKWEAFWQSYHL